jgi:hypothetical protein
MTFIMAGAENTKAVAASKTFAASFITLPLFVNFGLKY